MSQIVRVHARQILDSRGQPTVEVEVGLSSGAVGQAAVPSGASTGAHEALELRDGDPSAFGGRGVLRERWPTSRTSSPGSSRAATRGGAGPHRPDHDRARRHAQQGAPPGPSTPSWAARPAVAAAAAADAGLPLYRYIGSARASRMPVPLMNILNGSARADSSVDLQEFMVAPVGARNLADAVRVGAEVYASLKSVLRARGLATGVGDEGGFAPDLESNEAALQVIMEAINGRLRARGRGPGARPGDHRALPRRRLPPRAEGRTLDAAGMVDYWEAGGPLPDRLDRGRHGRGGLGRLGRADRAPRGPRPAGGRRPVRHQRRAPAARHRDWGGERAAGEAQADRHPLGDPGRDGPGEPLGLRVDGVPPLETEDTFIADLAVATGDRADQDGRPRAASGSPIATN